MLRGALALVIGARSPVGQVGHGAVTSSVTGRRRSGATFIAGSSAVVVSSPRRRGSSAVGGGCSCPSAGDAAPRRASATVSVAATGDRSTPGRPGSEAVRDAMLV